MDRAQLRTILLVALLIVLLTGSRGIANFVIEYQWWQELGQVDTWFSLLLYQILPAAAAALFAWVALGWAHQRGAGFAAAPTARYPLYSRLVGVALLVIAVVFIGSSIDSWTVMAYIGSMGNLPADGAWTDPVFARDLSFYLFDLPFYRQLLRFVFVTAFFSIVIFWGTARGWQLYEKFQRFRASGGSAEEFDPGPNPLMLPGATSTGFAKTLAALALLALAAWFFLGRYQLLLNVHPFMVGMDWVDENVTLPLRWVVILACIVAIPLTFQRKLLYAAGAVVVSLLANAAVPQAVRAIYVNPNELQLERPYIERHIQATTEAYGLAKRARDQVFEASLSDAIDVSAHETLIDNIRLWDTNAFASTITQIQALRPYYRFPGIDIDRYTIDGEIKQVLLSPREIDVNDLPGEGQSWTNVHFIYTHGYGVVMAEVNRTTSDGLPVLLIQDAPPDVNIPDIEINRPEIYYGESTHDPIFVNTDQPEFDYPSGDENISSAYSGDGGFPINSLPLRLAAAISEGDYNILLTGQTNAGSRMMKYRDVTERVNHLAGFITWDPDPYIVINDDGRLVWIVDGFTTSDAHPYSQNVPLTGGSRLNYMRNAVKATVDAFDGTTTVYVFEPDDPIIAAYRDLFPNLFEDEAEMPAGLRAHARYPEALFRVQAEIYRTYHMKNPEVFYNKEDVWEIGKSLSGVSSDSGQAQPMAPTYIVATVPGEEEPEFLLMLPFTPRGKDNLIGWMAARCDGEQLGELIFFQLSKQQLVFGPNQIESRINQDQQIAKDLSLWNQQGSRVLRGDIIALPVQDSFLYVESIYIQAQTARMPQLKKVVIAIGDRVIYEDTFERALARLGVGDFTPPADLSQPQDGDEDAAPAMVSQPVSSDRELASRVRQIRQRVQDLLDELQDIEEELNDGSGSR